MNKKIHMNWYMVALIVLMVVSIIPLLMITRYDHPSADDYSYTINVYHEWISNHSIRGVLVQAVETSKHFWNTWQGLYSSAFVLALQPAIFGEQYYFLTGVIMMAIIFCANIFFASFLCRRLLHGTWLESITIGVAMSFVMLQWMPSPVQGLYWFNGAMNYVLFYGIMLLLICLMIGMIRHEGILGQLLLMMAGMILGVILSGGNHVTAFMGILFLCGCIVYTIAFRKFTRAIESLAVLGAAVAGFIFNVTSPGTVIRQSNFTMRIGAVKSIELSIQMGLKDLVDWCDFRMIIIAVLLFPVLWKMIGRFCEHSTYQFKYPVLVFVLSLGWLCAMFCPSYYAMANEGAGRLTNVVYFCFVILYFMNLVYFMGYVHRHIHVENNLQSGISLGNIIVCGGFVLMLLIGVRDNSSSYIAWQSMQSGEAQQYSTEAYSRVDLLENGAGQDVELESYSVHPGILFFDDISEDATDWKNVSMSDYYQLNSVVKINP